MNVASPPINSTIVDIDWGAKKLISQEDAVVHRFTREFRY
jgi:hypothetical protein